MNKNTLNETKIKQLCNYDEEHNRYVSKEGDDYIKALKKVFNIVNINDIPFTIEEIKAQPTLDEFSFSGKNDLEYICDLITTPLIYENGKRTNERIIAKNFKSDKEKDIFDNSKGVTYMFTCKIDNKEHIIKIGNSRKTFKDRLQSYNCGCVNNWRTASTTNIKILQSFLTTRQTFKLYICDFSKDTRTYTWHGIESAAFASPMSLVAEDILIKQFIEQFNKKPLANVQADANN